jgi:hypothetical protein
MKGNPRSSLSVMTCVDVRYIQTNIGTKEK